ncbi:hypothetical protein CGLO_14005 [Colletotrichum gloeosporioides Cg-14]|uniref:Uncharacterized protein n=1 Tax=Colletotrichum gloeosporioides (strain Cg-14) TaxID=1237896 RepID=T0L5S4_COLGC|nr:hypothetical protein CGLO_14005 [Colletotrichum gloeosporioides Cg-14]
MTLSPFNKSLTGPFIFASGTLYQSLVILPIHQIVSQ